MPGTTHKVASFKDPNIERQVVELVRGQNATLRATEDHASATSGVHGVGESEVESKAGAQAKADAVQANLNAHAARTDNLCNVGKFAWSVLPNGDLLICHNGIDLAEWRLGSIYSDAVNTVAVETSRRMDRFSTDRPQCVECCARTICMGVNCCAAEFLRCTGDVIEPPESYCTHLRGMATGMRYWLSLRHRDRVRQFVLSA